MTIDTIDTILTAAIAGITIGSFLIGMGYMLWKGL